MKDMKGTQTGRKEKQNIARRKKRFHDHVKRT